MNNYPIASESIDLEIYQLACVFAASNELYKLSNQYSSFKSLVEIFELSEVSKKLISLAITLRNIIENRQTDTTHKIVGSWIKDIEKTDELKPLNLREACNKIIHALDVEFFETNQEEMILNWKVRLFGSHNKKKWQADIDIKNFLECAFQLNS